MSFDFDECGSIVGVNYYQLALSDYYAEVGLLTCNASAVTCEIPVGADLDANLTSFYNGEAGSEAIESTNVNLLS